MLDYNLEYLRAFYYVVKLGSFTKAAKALFVSQPAVSHSISQLEEHLGCKLINRSGKHIDVTGEGRDMYECVSKAMDVLSIGEQRIIQNEKFKRGVITISTSETPLHMVLMPSLDSFRKKYPEIFIKIIGGGSSAYSAGHLNSREADIAMGILPFFKAENANIYKGPVVKGLVVVNPKYFKIGKEALSAEELAKEMIICSDTDTSARSQIDMWFSEQGIVFKPTYSVKTTSIILEMAKKGLGMGIVPNIYSEKELKQNGLVEVQLQKDLPSRNLVIAESSLSNNRDLCRVFISHLLEMGLINAEI